MNSKYRCYLQINSHCRGAEWHQAFYKTPAVIFLFAWFMASSVKFSPLHYCIAAALFFSWMGDVFLLLEAKVAVAV
jgi:uncharacterized membrane protein YhhN